jgi:hypothetical protein
LKKWMRPLTRCNSDLAGFERAIANIPLPQCCSSARKTTKGRDTSVERDIGVRQRLRSEFRNAAAGRSSVCESRPRPTDHTKTSLLDSSFSKSALGARMVHPSTQVIQRTLHLRSPCRHLLIFPSIYSNGKQLLTNRSRGSLPDHLRVTVTVPIWHKKSQLDEVSVAVDFCAAF